MATDGDGTRESPWRLKTAPGTSEYEMWRDESADSPALVCQVGSTQLRYHLRAIEDYEVLVYGAIVVLVVMFAPSGLAGGVERWLLQRRRAVASGAEASA